MRSSGFHNSTGVPGPIQRIRNSQAVASLNDFLRRPAYMIVLAVLTVICYLHEIDLISYTVFLLVAIYVAVFGDDLLPLVPLFMFCYIAPSHNNNPGSRWNPESIFYPRNGGYVIYTLLAIFVACLVIRLIRDPEIGGRRFVRTKRSLTSGMLFLGAAYLIGGFGIPEYADVFVGHTVFALAQFASVFLLYYLLTGGVKWDRVPKDYIAWVGLIVGFVVLPQLLENYLSGRVFLPGTHTIDRERMFTGWGMHNNIGGMLAMMIPFPFYLASRKERGWIYTVLATLLLVGAVLSCSRTSMIVAAMTYSVCVWLLLRDKQRRKQHLRVFQIFGAIILVFAVVFFRKLLDVFDLFLDELFQISQRDNLFEYGMKQFFQHPILGGSFFPQGEYVPWTWISSGLGDFLPPRWHNTVVQVLASCGMVGMAAYSLHRLQTIRLFTKRPSVEKQYIVIYICILLVLSLFDCHFFNVGPVLFYSMALAFAEKLEESKL
ncbi:MAG: O-antigen ligase family protein [Oscillospiraceae bacterium]|nr:O-antigen ligase family protein [Oscillospiraceae bacterium]